MKILVTGAKGFIGKNLITELRNQKYINIFEYDIDTEDDLLFKYTKNCDFVFHLAGINRPKRTDEYVEGNVRFTEKLLDLLRSNNNKAPILFSSSIHAATSNEYGISKKTSEDLLFKYSEETGVKVLIYRFPNVFGKWCRPNYNSAVATFCYNIANNKPITINNPDTLIKLTYIDDVVKEMINALSGNENRVGLFCEVPICYTITLSDIVNMLYKFRENRNTLDVPNMSNDLEKKLYSTYVSYLPIDQFNYKLYMNIDTRGSFTEIIKTKDRGQFSVNVVRPGITKGNHWHHTKTEKFIVVSGKGLIRLRQIDSHEIIEYYVSGDKIEAIDIPVGYTHNITNIGDNDLIVFIWVNEIYDANNPDTYLLEV